MAEPYLVIVGPFLAALITGFFLYLSHRQSADKNALSQAQANLNSSEAEFRKSLIRVYEVVLQELEQCQRRCAHCELEHTDTKRRLAALENRQLEREKV